jgi:hypothetical protein
VSTPFFAGSAFGGAVFGAAGVGVRQRWAIFAASCSQVRGFGGGQSAAKATAAVNRTTNPIRAFFIILSLRPVRASFKVR